MPPSSTRVPTLAWHGAPRPADRTIPEETPIAITYNRVTHAVMMATPADLHDFALGFSLAEEIVPAPAALGDVAIVAAPDGPGLELRCWIASGLMHRLEQRRRRLAGATGCGMCGLESLDEALRPPPRVGTGLTVAATALRDAMRLLRPAQPLNDLTRAVHAAGFWTPADGLLAVREDVGRHNALDKLAGALALAGRRASDGVLLLTSRISIELVQKAARMGAPLLAAVSAPTALAVRTADVAGITLAGIARDDGFEVFTHPRRIGV